MPTPIMGDSGLQLAPVVPAYPYNHVPIDHILDEACLERVAHAIDLSFHIGFVDDLYNAPPHILGHVYGIDEDSDQTTDTDDDEGRKPSSIVVLPSPGYPETVNVDRGALRNVPLSQVLHMCARLLKDPRGSESTFRLSEPADHLQAFISHNWSVDHVRKWLALALHYNVWVAACLSLLTGGFSVTLIASGAVRQLTRVGPQGGVHDEFWSAGLGFVVFHAVLLFGHDILPCHGSRLPRVFLHKTCTHQTNDDLRRGVAALGACVRHLRSMVVLFADVYTERLWTVYELVCFLSVHPADQLIWCPVDLPPFLLLGSVICWLYHFVARVLAFDTKSFSVALVCRGCVLFLMWVLVVSVFRNMSLREMESLAQLQNFSLQSAPCGVESDRPLVQKSAESFMKEMKLVSEDLSTEESMASFEAVVHEKMPEQIRWSGKAVSEMLLSGARRNIDVAEHTAVQRQRHTGDVNKHRYRKSDAHDAKRRLAQVTSCF